ncbi:hypothetical protein MRX96_003245 [Rhipicephalus microplus]
MGTPRSCTLRKMRTSGLYHYFCIKSTIERTIQVGSITSDTIPLLINNDELPIAKSSSKQFWPILASVEESSDVKRFVIALFVGNTKPESLKDYLRDFIAEVSMLEMEGFT